MGIGHGIWQVEGIKSASVWAMDNIKLNLQEIGQGRVTNLGILRELPDDVSFRNEHVAV